jgi:5-oxoprolinase (ATP-hydrolysing)
MDGRWDFWIDRGGTFTDVVARRPDGGLQVAKLLSHDPSRYGDPAIEGIRRLLRVPPGEPVGSDRVREVRLGTTVATNALLERKGEPCVLVITQGFADALRIAYQARPAIFDRHIVLPQMLYSRVIEARERIAADGKVIVPLDEDAVTRDLRAAYDEGFRALAVVCLHAYRYRQHESRIGEIARQAGFTQVSESHATSPLMKLISRGDTTVVDAYLSPILARYSQHVASELPGVPVQFMQSNGGMTSAATFRGKDAILSGPAGGIVGMARTAQAAGYSKVIGFDMGGTSTDVSHFAGEFERQYETEVAGVRMRAPMLAIHTVAAGGGSLLRFDGSRYRVGPGSAGADPGPAAYRRGGPLTVTDANIMLGRVQPDWFPKVFGPGGDQPLDAQVVLDAFGKLARRIGEATGAEPAPEEVAAGFVDIAVENMANAIKKISVQRGYDVTGYVLATFGGAGGQHACAVADALGITRVLIHPLAGVLSAYGMGLADVTAMREAAVEAPLTTELLPELDRVAASLEASARAELKAQETGPGLARTARRAHLRYAGTDTALPVPLGTLAGMTAAFERAYRQQFSFLMPDKPVVVEAVSVEASISPGEARTWEPGAAPGEAAARTVEMCVAGEWRAVPLARRQDLAPGRRVDGPALIVEDFATTVVEPGWRAEVTGRGDLLLARTAARPGQRDTSTEADPVMLEIFNNLFMSVAEQMGARLRATAHSVNIKERLDFSCALFDAGGGLIANAPHMPVHLGSMGESIKIVAQRNAGRMRPGDVYALNDPYHGGTHLPDVTVVTPMFGGDGKRILFYVASRGHHAEIGGITPGSMPAFSTRVQEEGVLIDNWLLVRDGRLREAETLALLRGAEFGSRNPEVNLADLRAQIAANERGVAELRRMAAHFGLDVVHAYMRHVQDNAEESVRRVIAGLRGGEYAYEMDNGAVIKVAVRADRAARTATIDFTGTSPQMPGNFNAPSSVAMAAVLYVLRTLVADAIPLNSGCLKPVEVIIPPGSLLAPRFPAAVAAGNVETSQAITGALYAALGVMAEGSGTMNNVTFGNEKYQYYETVASGSGAGEGFSGADVVQTHMTNSRLTDPEVLEWRFPVRVERYEIRRGSGGAGRWQGGDGGRRVLRFSEPVRVTTLASHRRVPPYGMAGGQPGALGRHWLERAGGEVVAMQACDSVEAAPGDRFIIETPGGGGYGSLIHDRGDSSAVFTEKSPFTEKPPRS